MKSIRIFNDTPWRLYLLIGIVGLIVAGSVGYSFHEGNRIIAVHTSLADAAEEIQMEMTAAHLWFDEVMDDHRQEDMEKVWRHLDQAEWYVRAMLEGAENSERTFVPLEDPGMRRQIEKVQQDIAEFREIARQCLGEEENAYVDPGIERHYDTLFAAYVDYVGVVESQLQELMKRDLRTFRTLHAILMTACLLLIIIVGMAFRRFERRGTEDLLAVGTVNEDLEKQIADRKQAEQALRKSEEFTSSLLTSSPNPMLVINTDTSIRYINPALEELTGFPSAELVGKKAPYPWWTEETLQKTSIDLKASMRKGARGLEELFQKKDGERFWVEITSTSMKRGEELEYYLANWVDITERKRTEQSRLDRLKRAQRCQDAMAVLVTNNFVAEADIERAMRVITEVAAQAMEIERASVWLLDEEHRELQCVDLFQKTPNMHSEGAFLCADDYPRYFEALRTGRAIDAADAHNDPRTSEFSDGYLTPLAISSMLDTAVRVSGRIIGVVCHEHVGKQRHWTSEEVAFASQVADQVAQAIINSQRKRAERALRESEEQYRTTIDSMSDMIHVVDTDLRINLCNVAFRQWNEELGLETEAIGRSLFEIFPFLQDEVRNEYHQVFETGKTLVTEESNKFEDREIITETRKIPVFREERVAQIVTVVRDITRLRRAGEELRESTARLG